MWTAAWGRVLFAGEVAGFLNPMGEGISTGREAYRQSTENLKSYMQRQWSLVGGMAGTFREME